MPIEIIDPETGEALEMLDAIGVDPRTPRLQGWRGQPRRHRRQVYLVGLAIVATLLSDTAYWSSHRPLDRLQLTLEAGDHPAGVVSGRHITYTGSFVNNDKGAVHITRASVSRSDVSQLTLVAGSRTVVAHGNRLRLGRGLLLGPGESLAVNLTLTVDDELCSLLTPLAVDVAFNGRDRRAHQVQLSLVRTSPGDPFIGDYDPLHDELGNPGVCAPPASSVLSLKLGQPTKHPVAVDGRLYVAGRLISGDVLLDRVVTTHQGFAVQAQGNDGLAELRGLDPRGEVLWTKRGFSLGESSPDGLKLAVIGLDGASVAVLSAQSGRLLGRLRFATPAAGFYPDVGWRGGSVVVAVPVPNGDASDGSPVFSSVYQLWDGVSASAAATTAVDPTFEGLSPRVDLDPSAGYRCAKSGTGVPICNASLLAVSPDGLHGVVTTGGQGGGAGSEVALYSVGAADKGFLAFTLMAPERFERVEYEDASHWLAVVVVELPTATGDFATLSVLVRCSLRGSCQRVPLPGRGRPERLVLPSAGR